jgi:hypothetical protein
MSWELIDATAEEVIVRNAREQDISYAEAMQQYFEWLQEAGLL